MLKMTPTSNSSLASSSFDFPTPNLVPDQDNKNVENLGPIGLRNGRSLDRCYEMIPFHR